MKTTLLIILLTVSLLGNAWSILKRWIPRFGFKRMGERWHSTILISDLRGFTNLFEKLSPEEIVKILNSYFEEMTEIILDNGGTVDKFMGDSILAVFGIPKPLLESEKTAVLCALKMQSCLNSLNQKRTAKGQFGLEMGIGIAAGDVIAGNIGSNKRMEYTVIGNAVNTAYRLQSIAGRGAIMTTNRVLDKIVDIVEYRKLPPQLIKGSNQPIEIVEITGLK